MSVWWLVGTAGWLAAGVLAGVLLSNRWWLSRVSWAPTAPRDHPGDIGVVANPVHVDDEAVEDMIKFDREVWMKELVDETGVTQKEASEQVDSMLMELGLL